MNIKYVEGDLFSLIPSNPNCIIAIPHIVNDANRFGSGFAKAVLDKHPFVKSEYHDWFQAGDDLGQLSVSGKFGLGQVQCIKIADNTYIFNMVAQHNTISSENPKPIKYTSLMHAMTRVLLSINSFVKDGEQIEIHAPMFGSERAGGNWELISELISEIWADIPVTIYCLK